MAETTPHITDDSWGVNGNELTAWITDLEFFDISPSFAQKDLWFLHYNHVATAKGEFLGAFGYIADAQGAARTWLGDDDE
jgi:hypothetical protein